MSVTHLGVSNSLSIIFDVVEAEDYEEDAVHDEWKTSEVWGGMAGLWLINEWVYACTERRIASGSQGCRPKRKGPAETNPEMSLIASSQHMAQGSL